VSAQAVTGGTVLRVDAITSWIPPRDPETLVPASTRSVTVTFTPVSLTRKATTYGPTLVTDMAQVAAIVAAVNAAPVDTRGPLPCPMSLGGHMDLAFHGGVLGSTVATVTVNTDGCGRAAVQITGGDSVLVTGGPQLANTIMSIAGVSWPRMR
jgi:hypothetical protein